MIADFWGFFNFRPNTNQTGHLRFPLVSDNLVVRGSRNCESFLPSFARSGWCSRSPSSRRTYLLWGRSIICCGSMSLIWRPNHVHCDDSSWKSIPRRHPSVRHRVQLRPVRSLPWNSSTEAVSEGRAERVIRHAKHRGVNSKPGRSHSVQSLGDIEPSKPAFCQKCSLCSGLRCQTWISLLLDDEMYWTCPPKFQRKKNIPTHNSNHPQPLKNKNYKHIYIFLKLYVYIYIQTWREREREWEKNFWVLQLAKRKCHHLQG